MSEFRMRSRFVDPWSVTYSGFVSRRFSWMSLPKSVWTGRLDTELLHMLAGQGVLFTFVPPFF